jgi:hypothetical protein
MDASLRLAWIPNPHTPNPTTGTEAPPAQVDKQGELAVIECEPKQAYLSDLVCPGCAELCRF